MNAARRVMRSLQFLIPVEGRGGLEGPWAVTVLCLMYMGNHVDSAKIQGGVWRGQYIEGRKKS